MSVNLSKSLKSFKLVKLIEEPAALSDGAAVSIDVSGSHHFVLQKSRLLGTDFRVALKRESEIEMKTTSDLAFDGIYFKKLMMAQLVSLCCIVDLGLKFILV